jgi:DNA polymerase-3 subunit alpha
LQNDAVVLVRGRFDRDDEKMRILASEIQPIDVVRAQVTQQVLIRLAASANDTRLLGSVSEVLGRHRGECRVALEIDVVSGEREFRVRAELSGQTRVRPSDALVADIERICGPGTVTLR